MSVPITDPERKRRLEDNLRLACELHDLGVQLMEQNLRRRNPQADDDEIARMLQAWLFERPGAEWGDVGGRVRLRR